MKTRRSDVIVLLSFTVSPPCLSVRDAAPRHVCVIVCLKIQCEDFRRQTFDIFADADKYVSMFEEHVFEGDYHTLEVLAALSDVVTDLLHIYIVKGGIYLIKHEEGSLTEAVYTEQQA